MAIVQLRRKRCVETLQIRNRMEGLRIRQTTLQHECNVEVSHEGSSEVVRHSHGRIRQGGYVRVDSFPPEYMTSGYDGRCKPNVLDSRDARRVRPVRRSPESGDPEGSGLGAQE